MFNFKSWFATKQSELDRDAERLRKVKESQHALLSAATQTADAAQDVTSKLRSRLDDSLRQIEITSNLLSDALIICKATGVIESFNTAAEQIFGWKASEIVGQHIETLFRLVNGRSIDLAGIQDAFLNKLMDDQVDMKGKMKNGELFWVDGNLSYFDRADGNISIIFLVKDVTERVEIQRELKNNEQRYRRIFEQSFDGIFVVQNFYVVAANPSIYRILGYTPDELIAQPLVNFIHPDFHEQITKTHQARMNGDKTHHRTIIKALTKTGEELDIILSSTNLNWGESYACLVTVRDVSDYAALGGDIAQMLKEMSVNPIKNP